MAVTSTTTGRYCVGLQLFAVHFGYNGEKRSSLLYRTPLMWNNDIPDTISFKQLTVTEHHKVFDEWATDMTGEPNYDGYLLKDDSGQEWANQYPRASYSQTSDEGNRRFSLHCREEGQLRAMIDNGSTTVFQYHLLSDVLENMEKGIKDLSEVKRRDSNYKHAQQKLPLLKALYARTVKEFEEKYPDYHVEMTWDEIWEGAELKFPQARMYQRLSLDKARDLSLEETFQAFASERRLEVELGGRDRLVIEDAKGRYYIDGESRFVRTVNVFYLEHTGEVQDDRPCFYVCATEYFRRTDVEQAIECFHQRLRGDMPSRAVLLGKSIEMIYRMDIEANNPAAKAD